ncbi:MAG: DeoR/GlpR family DNA-binding transcription regulator [Chloroflexota bacterium]|nr:DeoR/GlpR family DNA-binding transcription regulator [Chloroflexota bacterium]
MSSSLIPAERRRLICELARSQGIVKVADLSRQLGVSEITVRRDLEALEQEDVLERTHGGAIYSQRMRAEPLYTEKDRIHRREKLAIGRAAAMLVEENDTLLVNSGSTTLQVIRHLQTSSQRGLKIITSNMGKLASDWSSDQELLLVGGTFRQTSNSLVGPWAIMALKQINANKAFIGVDGISARYGLTTPILQEAEIARMMIERTHGPVIVVADHSKVGVVADFVTVSADKVDILVTDDGFDEGYRVELEERDVEIIIATTEPVASCQ